MLYYRQQVNTYFEKIWWSFVSFGARTYI